MTNKKLFININDRQDTYWALGYYGTLKQWRETVMEWCDLDGRYGLYNDFKYYRIKNEDLIDFINEYWDIEIVEYNEGEDYGFEKEDLCYLGK